MLGSRKENFNCKGMSLSYALQRSYKDKPVFLSICTLLIDPMVLKMLPNGYDVKQARKPTDSSKRRELTSSEESILEQSASENTGLMRDNRLATVYKVSFC